MTTPAVTPAPLWTEQQLADYLGISVRTPQQWRQRGDGPQYLKVGASVRYRPVDVDRWLAERTRAHTAAA